VDLGAHACNHWLKHLQYPQKGNQASNTNQRRKRLDQVRPTQQANYRVYRSGPNQLRLPTYLTSAWRDHGPNQTSLHHQVEQKRSYIPRDVERLGRLHYNWKRHEERRKQISSTRVSCWNWRSYEELDQKANRWWIIRKTKQQNLR